MATPFNYIPSATPPPQTGATPFNYVPGATPPPPQLGTLPKPGYDTSNIHNASLGGLGSDLSNLASKFPGQELGKAVGSSLHDFSTASDQILQGKGKEAWKTLTTPDPNVHPEKVIGDTINAVALPTSLALGGGTGASVSARIGNAALKYGTAGGALGTGSAMTQGKSTGDVVKSGATGAITGAIGGATGQGISEGISAYKASKASHDFIDNMITPPTEKGKVGLTAIKSGKVSEGEGLLGKRDFSKALPNYDEVKASVAQVPGISPKNTNLENLNAIHENIVSTAENLKGQLGAETSSFTPKEFNKYMNGIKTDLAENPTIVGDAEKTAGKIVDKFNSLVTKNGYTPEGLLNARQELDAWMGSQKPNIFDPKAESAVSTAMRAIRQGGNKFLIDLAPNVEVKGLLAHQTNLYDAIDILGPKAQKEGASYISRLVGAVKAHPIGAAVTSGAGGLEIARKTITGHF